MPPKPSEVLQTKVNSLTHELELSTFLNKGILQSNNEYKLRIAELERENAVLRTAERTLTATEDALELSEKRVRELEREKSSWEGRFRREEEARRAVERERDGLKGWSDGIIGAWGVAAKAMQDALVHPVQEKEEEERRRASRKPGPSTRNDSSRATSKPRNVQADTSMESVQDIPVAGPSSAKKRRRKETTPPEDAEDEEERRQLSPSPTPPPIRRIDLTRKPATSSSGKKRPTTNTSRKHQEELLKPKTEILSPSPVPQRRHAKKDRREYSDDDPLAMG